jgi:hypothetical protein
MSLLWRHAISAVHPPVGVVDCLCSFAGLNHFAPVIVSATGTDVVRQTSLVTMRTLNHVG